MKVLFVGDIVGRPGRNALKNHLTAILEERRIDLCVGNAENCAGGNGVTPHLTQELLHLGIDVLTTGNHVWDKKEILEYIETQPRLLRPANYPPGVPGKGCFLGVTRAEVPYAVINVQGRVFMPPIDCPFRTCETLLQKLPPSVNVIILDFHAEATAEKQAMGWYFDGKVSAVIGTHTHVATADERVLPQGTAYITDVGMTGPHDSVIGVDRGIVLSRFISQIPAKFETASGDVRICAVEVEIDVQTGKALRIVRLERRLTEV
jgi:metallophosphoesterase (TIGR00282 family)